jgi:hypothetical protein
VVNLDLVCSESGDECGVMFVMVMSVGDDGEDLTLELKVEGIVDNEGR